MKMTISKNQIAFEGAEIGFLNFEGREGIYNKAGDRSFAIFLPEEAAKDLEEQGWNIKWPKPRPDIIGDDTRTPYMQVSVGFDYFPAKAYLVTIINTAEELFNMGRGADANNIDGSLTSSTLLGEEQIGMLDWAELQKVDLVIRPYHWSVSGKSGIKAYLKTGFFTLIRDEIALKYGI